MGVRAGVSVRTVVPLMSGIYGGAVGVRAGVSLCTVEVVEVWDSRGC